MKLHTATTRAFTLVEILVVVAIIGVLASIILPLMSGAQNRARLAREVNAGRNIMAGYLAYAANNDGDLMPGYDKSAKSIDLPSGTTVQGEMCARYPWRLAPYLGEQIEGVFLVNDSMRSAKKFDVNSFDYQYRASLYPTLGINAYCIGGYDDGTGSGNYSTDVVRKLGGTSSPARLIVFASARAKTSAAAKQDDAQGNFLITPPKFDRGRWATAAYNTKSTSSTYGNVAFRYDGKAVFAFLDGHTELLDDMEARDMRRWSNQAIDTDNANYSLTR